MTSRLMRDPSKSDEEWARIEAQYKRDADRRGWGDIRPGPGRPDRERILVRRPTRDLNDDRIWSGGSRDFDERSGTYRPGFRDEGRRGGRRGGRREEASIPRFRDGSGMTPRRGGRRGWWNEPRRPEPRREYPTEFSDRLSSDAERMRLLSGESDTIKSPDSSRPLRDNYDPVDIDFNRQFSEAPRGRQPWHSDPTGNPLERDPLSDYDFRGGRSTSPQRSPEQIRLIEEKKEEKFQPRKPKRNIKNRGEEEARIQPMPSPPSIPEPPKEPKYGRWQDAKLPDDRVYAGGPSPIEGRSGHDYVNQPKTYDDTDLKKRLAALEERGSIVNQPTQDLSGITGRLSELEGRKPTWQEDRIKALEGRKPDTSWKDPLSAVQSGQQQGQQARTALDERLSALESYYKNDPPPADSVGNRYEDKYNQLNKLWEREGKAQKWGDAALKETGYSGKDHWDYGYANDQGQAWAGDLPEGYVQGVRNLNREYNKPTLEAIIKGREYKAYDPRSAARLRFLDQKNIHEDTYLGSGNWKNQYGEQVQGWNKGDQDRYFKSQSGLDRESDEYKDRFAKKSNYGNTRTWGKDYAWYK